MKLVSVIHNNFYYTSDVTDMAARSTPLNFSYTLEDPDEYFIQQASNQYVKNLNDFLVKLNFGLEDANNISEQDIADMHDVIKDYHKAQKGAYLSFQNFFNEHPQIKRRYTNYLLDEEELYQEAAEFETIHMKSDVSIKNESNNLEETYNIRTKIIFDDIEQLNRINSIEDFDKRHLAMSKALEDGKFSYHIDISKIIDNNSVTVATYNNKNGLTAHLKENNALLLQLTDTMQYDAVILDHFYTNNAAFNDFYEKFQFIQGILQNCKQDNILNPVTSESVVAFKNWIAEQKEEEKLNNNLQKNQALELINSIRIKGLSQHSPDNKPK